MFLPPKSLTKKKKGGKREREGEGEKVYQLESLASTDQGN
jgi:hypothetical protein